MEEYELVRLFQSVERQLENYGYSVGALGNGFYISNQKGTMVATCDTVDGLRTFMQALEMMQGALA